MSFFINKYKWLIFLLVQILLWNILSSQTTIIDNIYIPFIFKSIAHFLGYVSSIFSFSIGLVIWYILGIFLIYKTIKFLKSKNKNLKKSSDKIFKTLNVIYPIYMLMWGLAYYQSPIATKLNYDISNIKTSELDSLCKNLISKTNAERSLLPDSILPAFENTISIAKTTAQNINLPHPVLKIATGSRLLSYMNTGGIYNFMSGEANVNAETLPFELPSTSMHELAHQQGYASEDEANFIAYASCKNHKNPLFRYSANYGVVFTAINKLWAIDSTLAKSYYENLSAQVKKDRRLEKEHWEKYQNPFDTYIVRPFYNQFLKSNGQEEGVNSYNKVLELLIGEKRKVGKLKVKKTITS